MLRRQLLCLSLTVFASLGGCSAPQRPTSLRIGTADYERAFAAAVEAAREVGYAPALRDIRTGVIETEPLVSATVLEPWHIDGASAAQVQESTLHMQRRRVRFEFVPADHSPEAGTPARPSLAGPDLLTTDRPLTDLTAEPQPLELRIWAYVERKHDPGLRRDTWTRRNVTRAVIIDPVTGEPLEPSWWTPFSRDPVLEGRLLSRVQQRLGR